MKARCLFCAEIVGPQANVEMYPLSLALPSVRGSAFSKVLDDGQGLDLASHLARPFLSGILVHNL